MELPAILLKELLQFVLVEKFVHQTNVKRLLTLVEALVDDSFDFNLALFLASATARMYSEKISR